MDFDRVLTVAINFFLVTLVLFWVSVTILFSMNFLIAIVIDSVLLLFCIAISVYFIIEEAEKLSEETKEDYGAQIAKFCMVQREQHTDLDGFKQTIRNSYL